MRNFSEKFQWACEAEGDSAFLRGNRLLHSAANGTGRNSLQNTMRIAFAMINCNRRDGSARPVNEVAERLAKAGHEVHLFATKAEDIDLGLVRWHRVPGLGWPEVANFSSFHFLANRMIRAEAFDIVHSIGCNTLCANVVTIQNIQPAKAEIAYSFGGGERISLARRFTRWLYHLRTCAAEKALYEQPGSHLLFLPVSHGVEAELRKHYAIGNAQVRIIPNAADTSLFHPLPAEERVAWRERNRMESQDFVAVFSGGEWARKGLESAIRAVALVRNPLLKLYVAGDDPDRMRFRQLAADLGVAERVMFGGFRKDIAEVMGAGDIFLFPSHYEAFSLATIEAAACGLPVFAPRINGTEDFIQPGVNGEFITREPSEMACRLEQLLSDPDAVRRMGVAARQIVEQSYTWDRVASLTLDAYKESLAMRT